MLRVPTETAPSSLLAWKKTEGFLRLAQQQHRAQGPLLQAPHRGRKGGREALASTTYTQYSSGHSKAQPLPGLHPRKPLNCINKSVLKFQGNSLTLDCTEKFIFILQRYICNQFSCREGRQDALWSCRYCRAQRETTHNCPQLLKSSWSTNSSSFHCPRDNKRVSQYTLLRNTFLTFSPFQTFSVTLCHSWLLTADPQLHLPASSSTSFAAQNSHQKNHT